MVNYNTECNREDRMASPDSNNDSDNGEPRPPPLSNPRPDHKLLTHQYDSLAALKEDLGDFSALVQFSYIRLRGSNHLKDFGPTRVDFGCLQGKIRKSIARSRSSITNKQGCP